MSFPGSVVSPRVILILMILVNKAIILYYACAEVFIWSQPFAYTQISRPQML